MAKTIGFVEVDVETCKGCDICVHACPHDVLKLSDNVNGKGYRYTFMNNPEACTGCTSCALVCPDAVLTIYRMRKK